MKLTSSSRWAQDRTQNSSINFSSSNPAPSLVLPRFVWTFRVLFFLPNVEDVVALWPDRLALLRSDIGARRADGGGPCPCWTPDYFIHASKLHIQAFTLKHEAKQTKSKQTRRQKCPIHFSPSLSTDFFFFHSLRATLSLYRLPPPPPPLLQSGCRVSFFQPHGAAHAKRGRSGRRAHVATPPRRLSGTGVTEALLRRPPTPSEHSEVSMTCCPTDTDRKPRKAVVSGGLAFLKVDTAKN